jgi:hypothetical protein
MRSPRSRCQCLCREAGIVQQPGDGTALRTGGGEWRFGLPEFHPVVPPLHAESGQVGGKRPARPAALGVLPLQRGPAASPVEGIPRSPLEPSTAGRAASQLHYPPALSRALLAGSASSSLGLPASARRPATRHDGPCGYPAGGRLGEWPHHAVLRRQALPPDVDTLLRARNPANQSLHADCHDRPVHSCKL